MLILHLLAEAGNWKPGDSGYVYHIISTLSEWLLAFTFLAFYLTFYNDFKALRISAVLIDSRYHSIYCNTNHVNNNDNYCNNNHDNNDDNNEMVDTNLSVTTTYGAVNDK
eukprot:Pgem_evm1s3441